METIALLIIFTLIIFVTNPLLAHTTYHYFVRKEHLFRYDKKNPHIRYCKRCGQEQNEFADCWSCNDSYWKDVGEIKNENCKCHRFSKRD